MSAEAARLPSLIAGLDESWLDLVQEEALEPDLPICDPHHHLWEREGHSYLLTGFLKDAAAGHRIVSTVFAECGAFYRADGPAEVRPVGEAEFVRSEEHTSELQSLMRISYAVFCLQKKNKSTIRRTKVI